MSLALKHPPWTKYEPCFSTRVSICAWLCNFAVCKDHYVRTDYKFACVAKSTRLFYFTAKVPLPWENFTFQIQLQQRRKQKRQRERTVTTVKRRIKIVLEKFMNIPRFNSAIVFILFESTIASSPQNALQT